MPGGATLSGIQLAPGGQALLSASGACLVNYPLTRNEEEFWMLGDPRQLPYVFPTTVSQFLYGRRPDGMHDLYVTYGGMQHMTAPADFFTIGSCSRSPSQFWDAQAHAGDCIDPMTNDPIYCESINPLSSPVRIRRRGGTHELFGTTLVRSRLCNILLSPGLEGSLTPAQHATIDANGDGKLNIADLVHLVKNNR
jgi:hypothetical protein